MSSEPTVRREPYDLASAAHDFHLGSDTAVPPVRMHCQWGAGNEAFVLRYLRERPVRAKRGISPCSGR